MKKIVMLAAVLVLALPPSASAADIILKFGLSQSRLSTVVGGHSASGFSAGAAAAFRLFDGLYLQPECLYVRRGDALGFPLSVPGLTSRVVLDVLEIPLLVKWDFIRSKAIRIGWLGGGYAALLTRAESRWEYEGASGADDLGPDVNKADYGLIAGIAVEYAIGRIRLSLDVRYDWGLKVINRFAAADDWKNRSLSALLGVVF
jgi:hypothetical protein